MNMQRLLPSFITAAIAGTTILSIIPSAQANPTEARFACLNRQGTPATVALTKRGPVPVINWVSTLGSDGQYTPQFRCDVVSKRFQDFYENGTLNFLTTGIKNRQPVVCVANYKGGPCAQDLFTLKSGSNPGQTLRQLMAVRVGAAGPLNESASRPYFAMSEILDNGPVDNSIVVPEELAIQRSGETTVPNPAPQNTSTPTETPEATIEPNPSGTTVESNPGSEQPSGGLW